jgi:hypothetical protein
MTPREIDVVFEGVSIILCTLAMLSNFNIPKVSQKLPIVNLVIDEASQISVFNYLVGRVHSHILHDLTYPKPAIWSNATKLKRLCFFGDPCQCETGYQLCCLDQSYSTTLVPPHDSDTVSSMKSIFDFPHMKDSGYFLDTQCE